jgi:hypothetical protein
MTCNFSNEVWKPIPSLPDYIASFMGRIMRIPYSAPIQNGGVRTYGGEPTFGVLTDGRYSINYKGKNYRISRLVCEAFSGIPFDGAVCMHLNECSTDNRAENLAWGTQKENLAAPGFIAYCKRRGKAQPKLTNETAKIVKYGAMSCADTAKKFGISPATVSNIRNGRTWKHI